SRCGWSCRSGHGPTGSSRSASDIIATVHAMAAALKDSVDASVVDELAHRFAAVDDRFDARGFTTRTAPQLAGLELKGRMELIARELWLALGDRDLAASLACVVEVARAEPPVEGWP